MRLRLLLLSAVLVPPGCIEDTLSVDIKTEIHSDGSCARRIEYRLERIDREKGLAHMPIPEGQDTLLRLHRFPPGPKWTIENHLEDNVHTVVVSGTFASANDILSDYWRVPSPKARPAHNQISFVMDPGEHIYEYSETFIDPVSPVAAARQLARALLKQGDGFARELQRITGDPRARRSEIKRVFRETFALPLARSISTLARRPSYGIRERRELEALFGGGSFEGDLATSLARLLPGSDSEALKKQVDAALEALEPSLEKHMASAGVPLEAVFPGLEQTRARLHFQATLVMPGPITRANTCVDGNSARWEFEGDDLFGRGFEMRAQSAAP
jgi:hypothetical protein